MAPHAVLPADELATRYAHETVGRWHDIVLHEGLQVSHYVGLLLVSPHSCKM